MIGHDNDVQDLGWSYDSSILVSVGLDSKVVVWSGHTFEKLKTISAHQSHVKGLTFDPANKYFATASDDRTVKIFRFTPPGPNSSAHDQSNNFLLERTISAPFGESPLTTYFRRCSWSPDGNHIAAANAVNGPVSSVAIINRGSWDGDIHLIGHEGPVEVCAFSPRLFSKVPIENSSRASSSQPSPPLVTVIACAGQDKALSIWITSNSRPLVITQDLAVKAISDLAWSPDGKTLFATSLDGSIIAIVFEDGELGHGVSFEENERALSKFGAGRRGAGIVEGPSGLLLEERSREGELRGVEGRMGALMGDLPVTSTSATGSNSVTTAAPATLLNGVGSGLVNGNRENQPVAPVSKPQEVKDPHAVKTERLKQRVTITKDGKKRIAPLLVSSSGNAESSLPRSQLVTAAVNGQGVVNNAPQTVLDLSKPFDGLPKGGLAALLLGNKRKLAPAEGDDEGHLEKKLATASRSGIVPILSNTVEGLALPSNGDSAVGQQPTPEFIRPAVINPSLSISQIRLAVPKLRAHIVQSHGGISHAPSNIGRPAETANSRTEGSSAAAAHHAILFEARNPTGLSSTGRSEDREPARLAVTKRGQPIWQDYLPKSVLLMTGSPEFWAAACEDGSIYAWTPAGRRLMNTMVLESQPVILESRQRRLLCVTAVGMCYVWDLKALSSPHPPVSLAPLLDIATQSLHPHPTRAPTAVTSAHLNSEGRIVVTLSNGDGYAYSPALYIWQRLSEVWWAVGSQYWNTADASVGNLNAANNPPGKDSDSVNVSAGIIPYLERHTTNETLVRGRAYFLQRLIKQLLPREGYEGFEASVSVAHLENRLAAAMMLGSKVEFKTYLYMYARRLGTEGLRSKVEELLQGLLDGIFDEAQGSAEASLDKESGAADRNWGNSMTTLCGWSRKELLTEVVLVLGTLCCCLSDYITNLLR